jgi:hypothetical protein
VFFPFYYILQFNDEASFFLIRFIFDRVMKRVNGSSPVVRTCKLARNKFRAEFDLECAGVSLAGDESSTQFGAKVQAMLKGLRFVDDTSNFVVHDLTYDMLAQMDSKVRSLESDICIIKATGSRKRDAMSITFAAFSALLQSFGINDDVLSSHEGFGPLIGKVVFNLRRKRLQPTTHIKSWLPSRLGLFNVRNLFHFGYTYLPAFYYRQ